MKRNRIPVILLSCLLAVSVGFGFFSTIRWKHAEQEAAGKTSLILAENYNLLRRINSLPVLLQEDGSVSLTDVTRYMDTFADVQDNCPLVSSAVAQEEGWEFLISWSYSPKNLMGAGNIMVNALSRLSFDERGVCKPEGEILASVQALGEWKGLFDSAFETAYPTGQSTDMYRFYKETFVPIMEQKLFQNEDSVKLLEKIERYSELVKR